MPIDEEGSRGDAPDRNARWQRFVSEVRHGKDRPFQEHLVRFREAAGEGGSERPPPVAWIPSDAWMEESNLGRLMAAVGVADYEELHRWSVTNPGDYWREVLRILGLVFKEEPPAVLARPEFPLDPGWLDGARLNIVDTCFRAPPHVPAIVTGREGSSEIRTTSYAQLEALSRSFAAGLRQAGLRPGDGIALYMPMTVECVAAYLGTIRAGGRVVSIADSFSPAEVKKRLDIAGARTIVTVARYRRAGKDLDLYGNVRAADAPPAVVLPGSAEELPALRPGDRAWSDVLEPVDALASHPADPQDAANILFSSGTTGEPKAIPWTHVTPIKCAADGRFHLDIQPSDVVAWPTNIGWMMGPWLIYATLINGATMALYEGVPKGSGFGRFVQEAEVSILGTVPALVRVWRDSQALAEVDWTGVRVFASTGEPSNPEDYLWLMSRARYRAPIIEYCGGTEIGGAYLTGTVVQPASPATFTTPALGMDFVLAGSDGSPVSDGSPEMNREPGEVFLVPPSMGLSETLLNRDHFDEYYAGVPRDRRGRTLRRHGDRIEPLPGGFFRAAGRTDDTMNLGGIKVSSVRLEEVFDEHEAVTESAAVGVRGQDGGPERLVVFVVPGDAFADLPSLRSELQSLVSRKINPLFRVEDVVVVDDLPRTASGKVMRRSLRERIAEDERSSNPPSPRPHQPLNPPSSLGSEA